jgi:hypothetical protein
VLGPGGIDTGGGGLGIAMAAKKIMAVRTTSRFLSGMTTKGKAKTEADSGRDSRLVLLLADRTGCESVHGDAGV